MTDDDQPVSITFPLYKCQNKHKSSWTSQASPASPSGFFGENSCVMQLLCLFLHSNQTTMEKNLLIELLETGEKVSLYSPRFEGEEYTEFEKFHEE